MPDEGPKSAYELAMERLRKKDAEAGVVEQPLTDKQKAAIAEARQFFEAKMAEREILHRDALGRARNYDEVAKLNEELAQDRGRLEREREQKIANIRAGKT